MQLAKIRVLQIFISAFCRAFPREFLRIFSGAFPVLLLVLLAGPGELHAKPHASAASSHPFPYPPALKPQVEFWKHVFTTSKYTVTLHDTVHMKIYKVLDFQPLHNTYANDPHTISRLKKERINREIKSIRATLQKLQRSSSGRLSAEERRIRQLFSDVTGANKFLQAAGPDRIRSQTGIGEKFRQGLQISGRYFDEMEAVFRRAGLPVELTRLPLIESSFNLKAYSKVGAAGVWQFMRSTGRLFMRVDNLLDERRDPLLSTHAAAKLLKSNYEKLGTWPLAITAYNHGPAGMANAVRTVGSTDIAHIIRSYKGRSFGFASRNFYPEFLAALEVEKNATDHFGPIRRDSPFRYDEVYLTSHLPLSAAARCANISSAQLIALNPAFGDSIRSGKLYIPSGYRLRIPDGREPGFRTQYASLPPSQRPTSQRSLYAYHTVRRGQNLALIAQRYGTSVSALKRLNRIRNSNRIRVGQRLRVPSRDGATHLAQTQPSVSQKAVKKTVQARADTSTRSRQKLTTHTVRRGQTLATIAKRYRTSVATLKELNGLKRANLIRSGQKLRVPASYATHKVRRGQTLTAIAQRYGTTVSALKRLNGIRNVKLLRVGQTLRVPLS